MRVPPLIVHEWRGSWPPDGHGRFSASSQGDKLRPDFATPFAPLRPGTPSGPGGGQLRAGTIRRIRPGQDASRAQTSWQGAGHGRRSWHRAGLQGDAAEQGRGVGRAGATPLPGKAVVRLPYDKACRCSPESDSAASALPNAAHDMTGRQYVALTVSPGMPLPSAVPPKPGAVLTDEPLTRKAPICQLQPQRSSFSPGHKNRPKSVLDNRRIRQEAAGLQKQRFTAMPGFHAGNCHAADGAALHRAVPPGQRHGRQASRGVENAPMREARAAFPANSIRAIERRTGPGSYALTCGRRASLLLT